MHEAEKIVPREKKLHGICTRIPLETSFSEITSLAQVGLAATQRFHYEFQTLNFTFFVAERSDSSDAKGM